MNRNKGKVFFNEDSLKEVSWENIKHTTIYIHISSQKEKRYRKRVENIFEDIRA